MFCFFFLSLSSCSIAIGIDCGSFFTKSSIAKPFELPTVGLDRQSKRTTPSFFGFRAKSAFNANLKTKLLEEETELLIPEFGERALSVMDARPWMGTGYFSLLAGVNSNQITKELHVNTTAARANYIDIISMYLNYYIKCITEDDVNKVNEIALAFPASTSLNQRLIFENGLKALGYSNFSSIDDVDAMAYSYSFEKVNKFSKKAKNILFIDIGATTVKAYVVKFEISSGGKPKATRQSYAIKFNVGGSFITNEIADFMINKIGIVDISVAERQRIFTAAEKLKTQLTLLQEAVAIVENVEGRDFEFKLKRIELENLTSIEKLKAAVNEAVQEATKNAKKYDEIELTGGSSRIPIVQDNLTRLLKKTIGHSMNADEVIAIGAGYYSQFRQNQSKFTPLEIIDTFPLHSVKLNADDSQSFEICTRGKKCKNEVTLIGNTSKIEILYVDTSEFTPLLLEQKSQTFTVKPVTTTSAKDSTTYRVNFEHHPTRVSSIELCDKVSNVCTKVPMNLVNGHQKPSEIVQLFVNANAREEHIAKTKDEIEQLALRVLSEVERNITVRHFSNHTQRITIIRCAEKMKDWVRSKEAEKSKNLTDFSSRLSELKRSIGPVYVRIQENATFYENADALGMMMNFMGQAQSQFSAQAPNLDKSTLFRFKDKIAKTSMWLKEAIRKNQMAPPDQFLPIRPKVFKEKEVDLSAEFKKLQNALAHAPRDPEARANRMAALEEERDKLMKEMGDKQKKGNKNEPNSDL